MGCKREIGRAIFCLTLLRGAAGATAQPAEPLKVTRLAETEAGLLVSTASTDAVPDDNVHEFGRAVGDAVRTQQQSIDEQCRSTNKATGPIAARWAWEAHCRYRRY